MRLNYPQEMGSDRKDALNLLKNNLTYDEIIQLTHWVLKYFGLYEMGKWGFNPNSIPLKDTKKQTIEQWKKDRGAEEFLRALTYIKTDTDMVNILQESQNKLKIITEKIQDLASDITSGEIFVEKDYDDGYSDSGSGYF